MRPSNNRRKSFPYIRAQIQKYGFVFILASIYVLFTNLKGNVQQKYRLNLSNIRQKKSVYEKRLIWILARIYVFFLKSYLKSPFSGPGKHSAFRKLAIVSIAILVLMTLVIAIPLIAPATQDYSKETASVSELSDPYGWIQKERLIAHGLGEVDGVATSNSLEAIIASYKAGYRVFETDLIMTTDDVLVLRHDNWRLITNPDGTPGKTSEPMSYSEFRALKPSGYLTTLTFEELVKIMGVYSDIRIITDTKTNDLELTKKQFDQIYSIVHRYDPSLMERITPQFYSQDMYHLLHDNYDFHSFIYTLYMTGATEGEVVDFMKAEGLKIVTMAEERATSEFIALLDQAGITSCVHTINTMEHLQQLEALGVDKFYTDRYLTED